MKTSLFKTRPNSLTPPAANSDLILLKSKLSFGRSIQSGLAGGPIVISEDMNWPEFNLANPQIENPVGYLMVPIATIGEWTHPTYGKIKFAAADFAQMIENFEQNISGYEPPLFLGHTTEVNTFGERPAVAFLEALAVSTDKKVLWGFYSVVDDEVYLDVKKGKYRYSSAEIFKNSINSKTGDQVGTILHACALTNTPFLTEMPKVMAFSQKFSNCTENLMAFAFPLVTGTCFKNSNLGSKNEDPSYQLSSKNNIQADMPDLTSISTATEDVVPAPVVTLTNESTPVGVAATPVQQFSNPTDTANMAVLIATNSALQAELTSMKTQVSALLQENKAYSLKFSTQRQEVRLATIKSATLTESAKQAFSIAVGASGIDEETADKIIVEVIKMSQQEGETYLRQQGSNAGQDELPLQQQQQAVETPVQTQETQNPYANYLSQRAVKLSTKS